MKKLLFFLIIIIPFNLFAQDFELMGKVFFYGMQESGKIYFSIDSNNFDKKNFINYSKKDGYKFKMNISKMKLAKMKNITFSADSLETLKFGVTCTQKIEIGNIINSDEFKSNKRIKLKTDLLLNIRCESGIYEDAKRRGLTNFVGNYEFVFKDTIRKIKLNSEYFEYTSVFSKIANDYTNGEVGLWSFDSQKNILKFFIWRRVNLKYGLLIEKNEQFEFEVSVISDKLKFTSKKGELKKM